jgi:hypothetical protein
MKLFYLTERSYSRPWLVLYIFLAGCSIKISKCFKSEVDNSVICQLTDSMGSGAILLSLAFWGRVGREEIALKF